MNLYANAIPSRFPFGFKPSEASPIEAGVMSLPLIIHYVILSLGIGSLISILGYYVQWAYLTVVLMAIGTGLLIMLKLNSGHAE